MWIPRKKKSFTETDSRRDRKPEQSYIIEDIQLVAKHFPTKETAESLVGEKFFQTFHLVGEKFFQMFQEHL